MNQWHEAEQERLLEVPEDDDATAAEEDFALSIVLEDEDDVFDIGRIDLDLAGLEGGPEPDEEPEPEVDAAVEAEAPPSAEEAPAVHVDLTALEAERERMAMVDVDVPVPPRPDAEDRMARLQSAGQAMRQGIREEIQAATGTILSLAVEQVRAELDAEVRRFQDDMRREVEALKNDIRSRAAEEGLSSMELERRLAELTDAVNETRDAVLGLKKRYLPGSAT